MPHFNVSQFENIVSSFYEAAVQTRLWPDALAELSAGVGAVGASLVERRVDSGPGMVCSASVGDLMDTFVRENWSARNYRFERGISVARQNGVVTEGMILSARELDREPMQTGFLRRFGLRWFAGLAVVSGSDADILMSIDRKASSEPFSRSEVATLRRALPHIQRAGQWRWRLHHRFRADSCGGWTALAVRRYCSTKAETYWKRMSAQKGFWKTE
jgi:hypothetical protein